MARKNAAAPNVSAQAAHELSLIVVRIESNFSDGQSLEIGRMTIRRDDQRPPNCWCTYTGTMLGQDNTVELIARVKNFPHWAQDEWGLIARMLKAMNYR
jgi:hypothetical protein